MSTSSWSTGSYGSNDSVANFVHEYCQSEKFIGRFEEVETLGRGAFGQVILCRRRLSPKTDSEGNREECALKFVKVDHEVATKEATILSKLRHENIVQIYNWWIDDHFLILELEYCKLGSLAERIKTKTLITEDCWKFTIDILKGLAYLHSENCIHRDLKPGNILITTNSNGSDAKTIAKIADFGSISEKSLCEDTASRTRGVGTVLYMAPEGNFHYGLKFDMYSFGLVLYEIFASASTNQTTTKLFRDSRVFSDDFGASFLDKERDKIKDVIMRLTTELPDGRPHAGELLHELHAFLSNKDESTDDEEQEPVVEELEGWKDTALRWLQTPFAVLGSLSKTHVANASNQDIYAYVFMDATQLKNYAKKPKVEIGVLKPPEEFVRILSGKVRGFSPPESTHRAGNLKNVYIRCCMVRGEGLHWFERKLTVEENRSVVVTRDFVMKRVQMSSLWIDTDGNNHEPR